MDDDDRRPPRYYDDEARSKRSRWNPVTFFMTFRSRRIVTVEPVIFAYMLGLLLFGVMMGQYVLNRYGREKLRQLGDEGPWDFCITATYLFERSNGSAETVTDVENSASHLGLINGLAIALPSFIPALFYGPISDRIGRKPMLLLIATSPCIAAALSIVIITLNLDVYYLTLVSLIVAIGGSVPGLITITFAYIVDISSEKLLTLRIGVLEATIFIGNAVGIAISGQWLNNTGCDFVQPMWLYLACNIFVILYVIFYLPESLSVAERQARVREGTGGIGVVTRGIKLLFVRDYSRWRIWFGLTVMFVTYLLILGISSINTLFLYSPPLAWNAGLITIFQSVAELCNGIVLVVILPVLVVLRIPDTFIVLIGEIISIAMYILTGFVRRTWQMFVVGIVSGLSSLMGPPLRSIVSKTVAVEEQGALFSVIAMVQVIASNVATVVFFFFYPYTLNRGWGAGTVYFLMAAIAALPVPLVITMFIFRNKPGAVYKQPPLPDHVRKDGASSVETDSISSRGLHLTASSQRSAKQYYVAAINDDSSANE